MKLPLWGIRALSALAVSVFFIVGLLALMPRRSLGYIAEAQIEKATNFQYDVHVGGAALSGISGVKAHDIALKSRIEVSPNVAPGTLDVERLQVNAGLLSLLRRQLRARARIDFSEGHARALIHHSNDARQLEVQIFDISLMDLGILRDKVHMPLRGTLRGTVHGELDASNALVDAEIDMNILDLTLGPRIITGTDLPPDIGRFFAGEITVPALHAGDILLRAAFNEEDAFAINEFIGSGNDLRISGEGVLQPKAPLQTSELNLQLSFAIDPQWVEAAQIGALMSSAPVIGQAQQGENLVFSVTGPLSKPRFAPAGARRRVR